jgi:hypothetical protein
MYSLLAGLPVALQLFEWDFLRMLDGHFNRYAPLLV